MDELYTGTFLGLEQILKVFDRGCENIKGGHDYDAGGGVPWMNVLLCGNVGGRTEICFGLIQIRAVRPDMYVG